MFLNATAQLIQNVSSQEAVTLQVSIVKPMHCNTH